MIIKQTRPKERLFFYLYFFPSHQISYARFFAPVYLKYIKGRAFNDQNHLSTEKHCCTFKKRNMTWR